jgi:glycosyltransferase involved in cell wall biosynthesis
MNAEKQLAVVIPAYKSKYLNATLDSFANQTDKRFRIYVGDDASPEDINEICKKYADRLEIIYRRFTTNLGSQSLTAQWNRCVELTTEPWVWLFSDDDVADYTCIESFYKHLSMHGDKFDLLHFDVIIIDSAGKPIQHPPKFKNHLTSSEYTSLRLDYAISSYAVEYIFTRKLFNLYGGFTHFPMAWCSDDASWAQFSLANGIQTIENSKVNWRRSESNISNPQSPYKREKILACIEYLKWLIDIYSKTNSSFEEIKLDPIIMRNWFYSQLYNLNPKLGFLSILKISKQLHQITNRSQTLEAYKLAKNDIRAILKS